MPKKSTTLSALPIRNPQATETPTAKGLRLSAPRPATTIARFLNLPPGQKTFELDSLGSSVWTLCDGAHTIEQIIHHFAATRRLNLRESQIAVTTFLNTLAQRHLIAFANPLEENKSP